MKRNDYFIEWPEIDFSDINENSIENKTVKIMYKSLLALLLLPEVVIMAFYQILKFKA